MVFGEGGFLSVICKDFLHLCGCLVLHCFFEASSIYSSIIETKDVQRLIMKVGSINVCLLSCQFYYRKKKKAMYKYIDLTLEAYEEYFEISFSGEGVLLNSIMDIHCSTAGGGADQNWMAVNVRGGADKIFQFAEVINE